MVEMEEITNHKVRLKMMWIVHEKEWKQHQSLEHVGSFQQPKCWNEILDINAHYSLVDAFKQALQWFFYKNIWVFFGRFQIGDVGYSHLLVEDN